MPEFTRITHPHAPASFANILKANNKNELRHYEAWCYKFLGAKAMAGAHSQSRWYQSNGYFFFRTLTDAARFLLGARLGNEQTYNGNQRSAVGGLEISDIFVLLNREFS